MTEKQIRNKYKNLMEVGNFTSQVKNLIEPGIKFNKYEKYNHKRIYINRYEGHAAGNGIEKTDEIGMIDFRNDNNTWFDITKLDNDVPQENLLIIIIKEFHEDKIKEVSKWLNLTN